MRAVKRRAQRQIQHNRAHGRQQRIDQRDAGGNLGDDRSEVDRLAEQVAVAEIADQRVGEDVDEQAAERAGRHAHKIAAARAGLRGGLFLQVAQAVRHGAAGEADDHFEQKRCERIARVPGDKVGQREADGPGQPAGHAVQQHGRERRERVAQVKRRPGAQNIGDAEKFIGDKAERGHHADHGDLLHRKTGAGQRNAQQRGSRQAENDKTDHFSGHSQFPSLSIRPPRRRLTGAAFWGMLPL